MINSFKDSVEYKKRGDARRTSSNLIMAIVSQYFFLFIYIIRSFIYDKIT